MFVSTPKQMWYEKSVRITRNGESLLIDALDIQEGDTVYFLDSVPLTAQYAIPDDEENVLYIVCNCDAWPADMFLSQ